MSSPISPASTATLAADSIDDDFELTRCSRYTDDYQDQASKHESIHTFDLFHPEREHRVRFGSPASSVHFNPTPSPSPEANDWPNVVSINSNDSEGITSPLLHAIRIQSLTSVKTLLDAGANPDGVPICEMEKYSAFFLRFRPLVPANPDCHGDVASKDTLLGCMDLPQLSSLTWEEVEDRFYDGMAPFWCEQDFVPANFYEYGEALPAIVEAARGGSTEIMKQLLDAGADTSFWMSPQFYVPAKQTASSLSISSPIHAALQARDLDMLSFLLDLGFDPNTMPLSSPTRCFTPLMATIIQHEDFDYEGFAALTEQPNINFELRTPVYGVHLLHFAVATLNLEVLKHIVSYTPLSPLSRAGTTALGHTLLHIACMPANSLEVQRHSELIYHSIHETRDLHAQNDPHAALPRHDALSNYTRTDLVQQTAVVQYLWNNGIIDISKQDVHGNTALHYLCGCNIVNLGLLDWLLDMPDVDAIFQETFNLYGATANDLFQQGQYARHAGIDGPKPWFGRTYKEERIVRKQAIWRNLLGDDAMREL